MLPIYKYLTATVFKYIIILNRPMLTIHRIEQTDMKKMKRKKLSTPSYTFVVLFKQFHDAHNK